MQKVWGNMTDTSLLYRLAMIWQNQAQGSNWALCPFGSVITTYILQCLENVMVSDIDETLVS